jgi:dienelactone hydrolase
MPERTPMPTAATAALLTVLAGPEAAERPALLAPLPEPLGIGRLLLPPSGRAAPLVIILPDAIGDDGRAEPYAEALSARGIGSLTLGLGADADHPATPATDPASTPAAARTVLSWAEGAGFAPGRVALLGFGAGGRAALSASDSVPAIALYPGCAGLAFPPASQALVLHGAEAHDAAACAGLGAPEGVALEAVPGLGHGWDAPGALWPSPGPKLPDPAGGARVQARMDIGGTLAVAERVADHAEAVLSGLQAAAR